MKCERCGGALLYRSTNKVTMRSKWKCKECGHIVIDDYVPFEFKSVPRREPRHYSFNKGCYNVKKRINGHQFYLACFKSESMAKRFVALMKESDWDLTRVSEFKEACQV